MPNELAVPANVATDPNATELIRAWAAQGGLVCALNPGAWPKDRAAIAWGILLSDVARHVANALEQSYGLRKSAVLARMREVFNTELDRPAEVKGKFV
jgi:Domain of unknown function (DUF5076)